MFRYLKIKNSDEGYCVLHREDKGYYLSKVKIADSLGFNPVEVGSKKDCVNFINDKNNENNIVQAIQIKLI